MNRIVVAKIGGTSMSKFDEVLEGIIKPNGVGHVYVMSAYGGVTNLLLENKKDFNDGGVYSEFRDNGDWQAKIELLIKRLCEINQGFSHYLDLEKANAFVKEILARAKHYLLYMHEVMSSGYVQDSELLFAARELLASIGESHSVYNSYLILKKQGLEVNHVDLSGEEGARRFSIDERIKEAFRGLDLQNRITVVTGYVKGTEGIMREFDRGYSEVTFSKVCTLLRPSQAVIYKEFHLSSGDPAIIGPSVRIIGETNFDVADQLADIRMEAIHPKASKPMEMKGIDIRLANAFEPQHPGTLISKGFISKNPKVEIISGIESATLITFHDTKMVGEVGFDLRIMQMLSDFNLSYISKSTNANTIEMVIAEPVGDVILHKLREVFESVSQTEVALVCVIGSNMKISGITRMCAEALSDQDINILAISQTSRQTNIQFVVEVDKYRCALKALHEKLIS